MRSDFLVRLFAYRERPERAPLEDFLTEVFCEFIQMLSGRGHGNLVKELLSLRFAPSNKFTWSSQAVIDAGRPDILGVGTCQGDKEWTVIIENKIWAGFTGSNDSESEHQLQRYWGYLEKSADIDCAQLVLITHGTPPPAEFRGQATYWSDIGAKLNRWQRVGDPFRKGGMLASVAACLETFLKENNMHEIKLDLITIGSRPYWIKLKEACKALAGEAKQFSNTLLETRLKGDFCYPARMVSEEGFNGTCLMTTVEKSAGRPLVDAHLMVWSGIRVGNPWHVHCKIEDTPEYFVAITAWESYQETSRSPHQVIEEFNRIAGLSDWEIVHDDHDGAMIASLCRREPLTANYHPLLDLRAHARSYFKEAFEQLGAVPEEAWIYLSNWAHDTCIDKADELNTELPEIEK